MLHLFPKERDNEALLRESSVASRNRNSSEGMGSVVTSHVRSKGGHAK
jgi:hypothetical protein